MANVGYGTLQIIPSAKGFAAKLSGETSGPMDKAGKEGGKRFGAGMLDGVKGLAAPMAAAFGGAALVGFFSDAVKGASDLNETLNKSKVIFGSQAGAMEQWSRTSATSFGLSKAAALETAASFGNMFTQLGFTGQASADMSKGIVKLAADLGSFNNLPTAEVADMMSSAFRGEYDSLQRLIPNINGARVETEALAATGKKSAKELTAQEKAAAVLAIVMKDGAAANNDFAETSDGLANKQKIVGAQWVDLKAKIGTALLPAVTAAVGLFGDLLGVLQKFAPVLDKIPGAAKAAGEKLAALADFVKRNAVAFATVAGIITAVFLPAIVRAGVLATISGAQQVAAWTLSGAAAVRSAAVQTAAFAAQGFKWLALGPTALGMAGLVVQAWAMTAAGAIRSAAVSVAALAAQGAAWVASGARAVAGAAVMAAAWLASKASAVASAAIAVGALVAQGVAWAAGAAAAMASALVMAAAWLISLGPIALVIAAVIGLAAIIALNFDRIKGWVQAAWEWIKSATASTWEFIKSVTATVLAAVTSVITAAWDFIKSVFTAVLGFIVGFVTAQFNIIRAVITAVWSAIQAASSAVWNAIKAVVSAVVSAVVTVVTTNFNVIKTVVTTAWNLIKSGAETAWNAIKAAVNTAVNAVKATLAGLAAVATTVVGYFDKIRAGIVEKFNAAVAFVREIPGKIVAALGNVGGMLYGVGGNIVQGLANGISGSAGRVMAAVRNLIAGVPEAAKKLLGIHSPSRVFLEIGGYTAEGFALGVASGEAQAQAALARIVAPPAPPAMAPATASRGTAAPGGGGFNGPLIGTAYLREEVDVDVMAKRLEFALSTSTLGGGFAR